MAKYDEHRAFLQGILDMQKKHLSEIELRADELKDHIHFVEDSINALNVYEHITDNTKE